MTEQNLQGLTCEGWSTSRTAGGSGEGTSRGADPGVVWWDGTEVCTSVCVFHCSEITVKLFSSVVKLTQMPPVWIDAPI